MTEYASARMFTARGEHILRDLHQEAERCPEVASVPSTSHTLFVHIFAEHRLLERYLDMRDRAWRAERRVKELEAK